MRVASVFLVVYCLLLLMGCGGGQQPDPGPSRAAYTLTDLGESNGGPLLINNRGEVAASLDSPSQAAIYRNGHWTKLGTFGGRLSEALGFNDDGTVVGLYQTTESNGGAKNRIFLWKDSRMQRIDPPADALAGARDLNDNGQILLSNPHTGKGFLLSQGNFTELSLVPAAVNESGQVVGTQGSSPALWHNGALTSLGTLPGQDGPGEATGINDQGQVVGTVGPRFGDGPRGGRAFLWQNGQMKDLGTFGGPSSRALDINNRGEIIGDADTTESIQSEFGLAYRTQPFVYRDGKMHNLNAMLPFASGWRLFRVLDINDSGQIVGYAKQSDSIRFRIILLTPTP
jgi:probable HAF family extracellular repeat protein